MVEEGSFQPLFCSSFEVGTLLNLVFDPFEGSLGTVKALLHNSVTGGGSPIESSCEIESRKILPSLMFKFLKNL